MPTDRLLRYTLSGSSFLLFSIFFLSISGVLIDIEELIKNEFLVKAIAIILTTPLVGIIISTIVFQSLVLWKGYSLYYHVPNNEIIINWILEEKSVTTKTEINLREKAKQNDTKGKDFIKNFYPLYQIKVRKHITGEDLSFLERKWAVISIHRNIIGALRVSFFVSLLIFLCNLVSGNYKNMILSFNQYQAVALILVLAYAFLANQHIHYSIKVATDFEHKILMNAYENEQIKKSSSQEGKKASGSILSVILNLFK